MNREEESLQNALTGLWDIMESAEAVLKKKHNDSIDFQEMPDFSAVIQSILRDSGVLENSKTESEPAAKHQPESNPEPETGNSSFNDLPDYAASCRNLADIAWKVNECTLCGLCEKGSMLFPALVL